MSATVSLRVLKLHGVLYGFPLWFSTIRKIIWIMYQCEDLSWMMSLLPSIEWHFTLDLKLNVNRLSVFYKVCVCVLVSLTVLNNLLLYYAITYCFLRGKFGLHKPADCNVKWVNSYSNLVLYIALIVLKFLFLHSSGVTVNVASFMYTYFINMLAKMFAESVKGCCTVTKWSKQANKQIQQNTQTIIHTVKNNAQLFAVPVVVFLLLQIPDQNCSVSFSIILTFNFTRVSGNELLNRK